MSGACTLTLPSPPRGTQSNAFAEPISFSIDSKNPGNVTGGLKATIRNPRISESTKQSARGRLHERGTSEEDAAQFDRMGADPDQDVLDDMNNPEGPATRTRSKFLALLAKSRNMRLMAADAAHRAD